MDRTRVGRAKLLALVLVTLLSSLVLQRDALSSALHDNLVIENPANYTPKLVATTTIAQPHIDAFAQLGNTIFAGGLFDRVAKGSASYARGHFVAFDALRGTLKSERVSGYADPVFDGQVWAIAAWNDSVYVGGQFAMVNGLSRPRLVKISAATGAIDWSFIPPVNGGTVWDLKIWMGPDGSTPMLIVAGSMGKKLIALDPATGRNTKYFDLGIADAIPNAWGGVAVYKIAISPDGTKLVATGNFQTVSSTPRARLFVADLTGNRASLNPWYYPGFSKDCSSTHPRRLAYLQGVDFSPDGSYFVVVASGQIPKDGADIWPEGSATYHTVCDAAGRFNLEDDRSPVWINYTGGDSVWAAVATGAAVYVQGHFQWLDNPNGFASRDGGGGARRLGIGAIDPVTGKALPWNPSKPAQIGGKAFLATAAGLWIGSDSKRFNGEPRRGISFAPLP